MSKPKGTDLISVTIHLPRAEHERIKLLCEEHERQHPGARYAVSAWAAQVVLRQLGPALVASPAPSEPAKGKRRAA